MEIPKFEYLDNEKSFVDEIKSIFRNYSRAVIWRKKKKTKIQALKVVCRYIFPSFFCMSKIEHFENKKKFFI